MKHLLLYLPNDQFSKFMVFAICLLVGVIIVSFFEAWRIHDKSKSLKSKIKQNETRYN